MKKVVFEIPHTEFDNIRATVQFLSMLHDIAEGDDSQVANRALTAVSALEELFGSFDTDEVNSSFEIVYDSDDDYDEECIMEAIEDFDYEDEDEDEETALEPEPETNADDAFWNYVAWNIATDRQPPMMIDGNQRWSMAVDGNQRRAMGVDGRQRLTLLRGFED